MAAKKQGVSSGYSQEKERQGWKRRGGGEIVKWDTGMEVEGVYRGIRDPNEANMSPILSIETKEGMREYWCPKVLFNRLDGVADGARILIVCLGKGVETKRGTAWGFDVFTR